MVYIISLSNDIKKLLTIFTIQENRFVSFERCHHFMHIRPESGYLNLNQAHMENRSLMAGGIVSSQSTQKSIRNKPDWPSSGDVEFSQVSVKYRSDLSYVLTNISFTVHSGNKLGILGRTGAGKSTLISCIFRYFEQFEGSILISGIPIVDIDLRQLRSAITVIPQDPVTLTGTLRRNLDPGLDYSACEAESVLRDVGLWHRFEKIGGIECRVEAAGLSQGEKQLLCFGRALMRRSKVILMDEATSGIDERSEAQIQRLIQTRFVNSSVFMIAHRPRTILICDQILILDGGRIKEFGRLEDLKRQKGSLLHDLLQSADILNNFL